MDSDSQDSEVVSDVEEQVADGSERDREGVARGAAAGEDSADSRGPSGDDAVDDVDGWQFEVPPSRDDDGPGTDIVLDERAAADEPSAAQEVRRSVLEDVADYFAAHRDGDIDRPTTAFLEERWFDFGHLDSYEEVERYWVNRPFAYVSVLYDEESKQYRYHVSEPVLDDFERYVRDDLVRILRNSLMYEDLPEDGDREEVFRGKATSLIATHAATVEPGSVHKLVYYLLRDFVRFGKIDPLMNDSHIEDISCDGVDVPVYVYHGTYRDLRTNVAFDEGRLNSFVVRLAQRAGKHMSISDPLVDASLPDGSRIQLTLGGDVASRGSNFTIRKFSDVPLTPVDLVRWNTFSAEEMAYYWLAIENGKSLVFAGGTGSGKTTSLNAISFFVPPDSKVVSIEDTREITLPHENWIQSVARRPITAGGRGEISTFELLQAALRQRPEYILVGEIRTEQRVALTFFQAIGTGHTCYTTLHADSVESALSRLQNPPLAVPTQMIDELDIVSVQKQIFQDGKRVRRNHTVTELVDSEDADALGTNTVFARDASADVHEAVADSVVLEDVRDQRGWTDEELQDQLDDRRRIIEYLVDNDVDDHDDVAAVIQTFGRDPDFVMGHVEAGTLDPSTLPGERA